MGGLLYRRSNASVRSATADVAGHGEVDVGVARVRNRDQERGRRHDLARLTVAALRNLEVQPRPLDGAPRWCLPDPLDGGDLLTGHRPDRHDARADRLPVDVYGARTAHGSATAELRASQ